MPKQLRQKSYKLLLPLCNIGLSISYKIMKIYCGNILFVYGIHVYILKICNTSLNSSLKFIITCLPRLAYKQLIFAYIYLYPVLLYVRLSTLKLFRNQFLYYETRFTILSVVRLGRFLDRSIVSMTTLTKGSSYTLNPLNIVL